MPDLTREEIEEIVHKLKKASLSGIDLSEANLSKADLQGARLSQADLWFANLSEAALGGANLRDADLSNARYSNLESDDVDTKFPDGFDPEEAGMVLVE